MAVAVRIARAATRKDKIAFCGYHGWSDWYLSANLSVDNALDVHLLPGLDPAGVPRGLKGTMLPFSYNNLDEFNDVIHEHGHDLAAIVMEPVHSEEPNPGFLEEIRNAADRIGAVLVFDEITSGWKMNTGGIHMTYGVYPDLAAFAKAMSNGFAMAAVIGRRDIMEATQATFVSSTSWTERIGPTAALATIRKHQREDVPRHLIDMGMQVRKKWQEASGRVGLQIRTAGILPLGTFSIDHSQSVELVTLYIQEMLDRGILATTQFVPMLAHHQNHVNRYLNAVDEVFSVLAKAAEGDVTEFLRGPVKHTGYRRLD